jgi:uncharacterized membrane protein YeaQ/YmgE (transglycosylase-associated protein family)
MLYVLFVGLVAGFIARLLSPGPNNPTGFILTIVLGIAGAFLATFIGQAIGHYGPDQGAGFITATIGALVVLFIWNRLVARGVVSDPGNKI